MQCGGRQRKIWVALGGWVAMSACTTETVGVGLGSRSLEPVAPVPVVTPATAPEAPSTPTEDLQQRERRLREALATAPDPTAAAIELAQDLKAAEHLREALGVIDTALLRVQNVPLRAAKAALLRDLGQRHLAVVELSDLAATSSVDRFDPDLRFELAELHWLEGSPELAKVQLTLLRAHPGDGRWLAEHDAQVRELELALQRGTAPTVVLVRDLLGNLRGATKVAARNAVLEHLLAGKGLDAETARSVHVRALWIALGDESAAVRARAVQLGDPDEERRAAFYATAVQDPAALVRRVAAPRAAARLGAAARGPLLQQLAVETDAFAFQALHDALATLSPAPMACAAERADDAAYRATVVAAWQQAGTPR